MYKTMKLINEEGGRLQYMSLRNVHWFFPANTVLYPRSYNSSYIQDLVFFELLETPWFTYIHKLSIIQGDSKLLSGLKITGHGNPDNNLESLCIFRH
jgi:hypothetical protein